MGIQGLRDLIKRCPDAKRTVPLTIFQGKRIAIDAGNDMIRTMCGPWATAVDKSNLPFDQPDMSRFMTNWLSRLKEDLIIMIGAKVTPVYVFDGKPPPEKDAERAKRKVLRDKTKSEYDELSERILKMDPIERPPHVTQLKKLAKKMFPINAELIMTVKEFYSVLGIPVLDSNEEAERLCAQLCLGGYCSAVYTQDQDTLTHGAPIIITRLAGTMMHEGKQVPSIEITDLFKILHGLKLSFDQFVEVCIMCGCDYNERIPWVGPNTAYKLLNTYGNIERIPTPEIYRFFKRCLTKKPEYAKYSEDPKALLQVELCKKRFALISVKELLSEYDLDNETVNRLMINTELTSDAAQFLSSWNLDRILTTFSNLYPFHPQIPDTDGPAITPPDLRKNKWGWTSIGYNYLKEYDV
jgi:5'-3' exonuclease